MAAICLLKEDNNLNNYIVLCKKQADMYIKGILEIKRNGSAYINKQNQTNHIEIGVLKRIRKYLFY